MLFINVCTWEPENRNEMIRRRTENGSMVPEGVKVIGEWGGGHYFIRVYEAEDINAVLLSNLPWTDIMRIETYPAFAAEEVLKLT
jgi:hypothetical protein